MSRAGARAGSEELMDRRRGAHPGERWEAAQATPPSPKASTATMSGTQAPAAAPSLAVQQGDTYASFQPRDYKVWKAETDKFVAEGKRGFHDDNALGRTI